MPDSRKHMRLFWKGNELNDKCLEESVVRILSATEAEVTLVLFKPRTNRCFELVHLRESIRFLKHSKCGHCCIRFV